MAKTPTKKAVLKKATPAKKAPAKKAPAKKVAIKQVTTNAPRVPVSKPRQPKSKPKFILSNGMPASPQQEHIFDWIKNGQGNAFVEAVAGSGKTTTLVEALRLMPGSVAFTAFNKKIVDEINQRTRYLNKQNLNVGTFHSFGFNAWRRVHRQVQVNPRTKSDMMLLYCEVPERFHSIVKLLVSFAKQSAVYRLWTHKDEYHWYKIIEHHDLDSEMENPVRDIPQIVNYAMKCIEWSRNNGMHVIDFDDMLWLPVVTNVPMDQYEWVLVDEAQDTNPTRRLLAAKMMGSTSRLIMVGDRHQAIYGFTGADNDAVDIIIREFHCIQLPLTVTYRCPKSVVTEAQRFVSHITAHEIAPQGIVRNVKIDDFLKKEVPQLDPKDVILCRNTKPLIDLAFHLIRRRIPCHVEGRDIGEGLLKLACRWKIKTVDKLRDRLEAYREREVAKLLELKREASADALNDRIDTLLVLMEGCHTIDEVIDRIRQMFQDTDGTKKKTVTLSTVHKAKGREWDRVYILGWRELMPARWASLEWQKEQERNLQYVAVTRSKGELVFTEMFDSKKISDIEQPKPEADSKSKPSAGTVSTTTYSRSLQ